MSEPKRYIPYIAFENMAYPFPAMREVDANWKQYADVKMAYVTDADYARLKAEVERLTAFTTRTIIPNEELQAQVERLEQNLKDEKSANANVEERLFGILRTTRKKVERLTKAVMHSPAAQLKLKELEGKTTFEDINPKGGQP